MRIAGGGDRHWRVERSFDCQKRQAAAKVGVEALLAELAIGTAADADAATAAAKHGSERTSKGAGAGSRSSTTLAVVSLVLLFPGKIAPAPRRGSQA